MRSGLRLGLFSPLFLFALATLPQPAACQAGDGFSACMPELSEEPAAGDWKGELELTYTLTLDDGIAYRVEWKGPIELAVEAKALERAVCPARPVAGELALPDPGCDLDGKPIPRLKRDDEEPPELTGRGSPSMRMSMSFAEAGLSLSHEAASQAPAELEIEAERDPDGKRLEAIALEGTPDQFRFAASLEASDPTGRFSAEADLSGSGRSSVGVTMQTNGSSGTLDATASNGELRQRYEIVDREGRRRTGGTAAPIEGVDPRARTMFRLVIDERKCGEMSGRVESEELSSQATAAGMAFGVVQAKWRVEHEDRDEALERNAEEWAREPVGPMHPADPGGTFASWEREWQYYRSLRGDDPSDYVLCVLKPAHEKLIRASVLALQTLVESPHRKELGVKMRIWQILMVLEGFGRATYASCEAVRHAWIELWGVEPSRPAEL